jgi:hypothetical protein
MAQITFTGSIDAVSLGPVSASSLTPVKTYGDDGKRTDTDQLVDGHQVYALRGVTLRQDGEPINGASLKVKTPTDLKALTPYTVVNPRVIAWVRDGRVAYSVTADRLEVPGGSEFRQGLDKKMAEAIK